MEVNQMSKIRQQEEYKLGTIRPRRPLSSQLTKTFEVKTSRVYTLLIVHFCHLIDFHSKHHLLLGSELIYAHMTSSAIV